MFTIDQIKEAHSKVKSGSDFPRYVQELKALGVVCYDNYVCDGHTEYYGAREFQVSAGPKYDHIKVAEAGSKKKLQDSLSIHQQGQTDYPTFCRHAAEAGVEKWTVHMLKLTCTYYDHAGNEMLVEQIPVP